MELGNFGKHTLLTGAGFSRNWRGYTAPEMMEKILGHLQDNEESRAFWLAVPSFEEGVAQARAGEVSPEAIQHIERAVLEVFKSLDRQLQGFHGPWFPGVEKLLAQFYWRAAPGIAPDTGYLFTLNQDILIERRFMNAHVHPIRDPTLPGIRPNPGSHFFSSITPNEYDAIVATVEGDPSNIHLRKKFNYIKLHGSFNWRSETGDELMVMGNKKSEQITESPLLGWYHKVFKNVLFAGDIRLMIIGYGFGDEHINEVIAKGISEHGLRILVWGRQYGYDWIRSKHLGDEIVAGLIDTESREMMEVFPGTQEETESYRSICRSFF